MSELEEQSVEVFNDVLNEHIFRHDPIGAVQVKKIINVLPQEYRQQVMECVNIAYYAAREEYW